MAGGRGGGEEVERNPSSLPFNSLSWCVCFVPDLIPQIRSAKPQLLPCDEWRGEGR